MKYVSVEKAMEALQSHMRVYAQGFAATPHRLLEAFAQRTRQLEDVTFYHIQLQGPVPWLDAVKEGRLRDVSMFVGPNLREAVRQGWTSYLPIFYSDMPRFISQPQNRPHVALIQVSPPDAHGYVSLGTTVDLTISAVEAADVVIAQVNPLVPRTLGRAEISEKLITYGVEVKESLDTLDATDLGPKAKVLSEFVASLIPDRATLQMGIGKIPDAVLRNLGDHKDLGIHSEVISEGVQHLVESGVITGKYKGVDPERIVATLAMGSLNFYRFLDNNPLVSMEPVDYTNDTAVIRKHPWMISVNSATEVDLTGQVVAESIGSCVISGVGGQMDFVRGAALAPEGKSIIALPSRTHKGQSRIVATTHAGAGCTTTRAHVQYVATEFGVAELQGKTLEERARQLIAIAHPEDREELIQKARKLFPAFDVQVSCFTPAEAGVFLN